jgi:hypothetical protein
LILVSIALEAISIIKRWSKYDIALLKVDLEKNNRKVFLEGKTEISYLELDMDIQEEGTQIYTYGFPLPEYHITKKPGISIATEKLSPRITSAIIAAKQAYTGPYRSPKEPVFYAIDKELSYGNSGGPVIATETGKVVALCSEFQPVKIPQTHEKSIRVPSQYSIATAMWNIKTKLGPVMRESTKKESIKKL